MLHLAKVQKNFDSEKTVNFPARKLGNSLWPVKVLKTTRNVGANDNSKTIFNPNVGANKFFLPWKSANEKSYQNFNINDICIISLFVWKEWSLRVSDYWQIRSSFWWRIFLTDEFRSQEIIKSWSSVVWVIKIHL